MLVSKRNVTLLLLASLAIQTTSYSFEITKNKLALMAFIGAFGRLVTKEEPVKEPLTLKQAVTGLFDKELFSKEYATHLKRILDEVIIGFPGKIRGIKPLGSKIIVEGKEVPVETKVMKDGTKIQLYKYEHCWPYGFGGWTWAYIRRIFGELKTLREARDTLRDFNAIFDQGDIFAKPV